MLAYTPRDGIYPLAHYDDTLTLRDARTVYFQANRFGDDGGYGDAWVKVKFGPLPVAFPNTAGRVRAVRFHDLHHVLTGYETTNKGEGEIGAWEIASGCADHYAAWVLNFTAFAAAMLLGPRDVFRAFVRGRHSRNLYRTDYESLLTKRVGEARAELGLVPTAAAATAGDVVAFVGYCTLAIVAGIPMGIVTPALGIGAAIAARFVARSPA